MASGIPSGLVTHGTASSSAELSERPDQAFLLQGSLVRTNFPTPEIGREQSLNPRLQFIFWVILSAPQLCPKLGGHSTGSISVPTLVFTLLPLASAKLEGDFLWFRKVCATNKARDRAKAMPGTSLLASFSSFTLYCLCDCTQVI